jgi:hypothetical protein
MPDPYVREVGTIEDMDEAPCVVGVDYDSITLAHRGGLTEWRFTRTEAETFAHLFIGACREAGLNARKMVADDIALTEPGPIEMHDEGTGYCTSVPEHGDEYHPYPMSGTDLEDSHEGGPDDV